MTMALARQGHGRQVTRPGGDPSPLGKRRGCEGHGERSPVFWGCETMIYHFGECALDTQLCSVQRGEQTIRLRPKVFRMCLYLLEHRDRVVTREELCAQVWPGRFVNPATLEGVIRLVRQAVGDSGRVQGIILTRHSYGYRFVAGVEERAAKGADEPATVSSALLVPPEASG